MAILRFVRLHALLLTGLLVGVAVWIGAGLAGLGAGPSLRFALAWDAGVAVFVGLTFLRMTRADVQGVRDRAAALDDAGGWVLPLSLVAVAACLVVLLSELAADAPGLGAVVTLATVALSWLFVHLIFALHYAHDFYSRARARPGDKLIFPGEDAPDYWDFLHFALVIGVASQTADVQIADRPLRRLATVHSLIAFGFNTLILALAVNAAVAVIGG